MLDNEFQINTLFNKEDLWENPKENWFGPIFRTSYVFATEI